MLHNLQVCLSVSYCIELGTVKVGRARVACQFSLCGFQKVKHYLELILTRATNVYSTQSQLFSEKKDVSLLCIHTFMSEKELMFLMLRGTERVGTLEDLVRQSKALWVVVFL